jgi:integrase
MARSDDRQAAKEREVELVKEKAESGELTEPDKDAILRLVEHEEGQKKPSTIRNHVLQGRKTAERADKPLLDMRNRDLTDLFDKMRSGRHPDVKDSGIVVRGYQASLRVFYKLHDAPVDPEEIQLDESTSRDLAPSDLLHEEDVDRILRAAQRQNPRDAAMIALGLATGQRVDAIRTLRLKHVSSDGPTMEVQLNTQEGALKGATGTKPLLWAKHWVRPWYEAHPYRDDPEAALFCTERQAGLGGPDEPMSDDTVRRTIRRRVDDAGLEKDVYPHLLRHTAITRMVIEGLSEQKIKRIVGWSPDSSSFGTYVHLAEELTSDSVREELGVPTSDTGTPNIGRPPMERCVECSDMVPDDRERCPTCQTPLTTKEAVEGEADDGGISVSDMSDEEKLELIDELREELRG